MAASLEIMPHNDWKVNFTLREHGYQPWAYPVPQKHAEFIARAVNLHDTFANAVRAWNAWRSVHGRALGADTHEAWADADKAQKLAHNLLHQAAEAMSKEGVP